MLNRNHFNWSGFFFNKVSTTSAYPFETLLSHKKINMKTILVTLLVLPVILLSTASAQKVVRKGVTPVKVNRNAKTVFYNTGQLSGKWQEYQRKVAGTSAPVDFKDSLLLNFNKRDSVYVYDGISMSQRGVVSIDGPATLSLAGDIYTIVSLSKTMMVLNDGEFTRHFRKTDRFYHETLGKLKANIESYEKPVVINQGKLKGRWDIYRRQANPGTADSIQVKAITFLTTGEAITGSISFYSSGNTYTENFTGYITGTTLFVNATSKQWQWDTFKADGEEFVFGKDKEIIYYAKKLD